MFSGDEDDDDDDDLDGPTGKRAADEDEDDEEVSAADKPRLPCVSGPRRDIYSSARSKVSLCNKAESTSMCSNFARNVGDEGTE